MSTTVPSITRLAAAVALALVAVSVHAETASSALVEATAIDPEATELDRIEVRARRSDGYDTKRSSTATRTDARLLDVPQSITVVSQDQIRDLAVQGMADAVRYVPGIGITQGEGNRDGLVFRGNSSTADLFIDGMRDDVQYYRDTYNIDRIEAFKGPNAMIFGRGSPGGLLNRVTKGADWASRRDATLQVGSWNKQRLTGDYSEAVTDNIALRVTGVYEDSGSHRDGFTLERKGINPTLTIRAGENTLVSFGYEYFRDQRTADRGIPSYAVPFGGTRHPVDTDPSTFFGDAEGSPTWAEVNALSALVEHDFGDGVVLRNRTRHANYDKFYQNVFPGNVDTAGTTVALSAYNNETRRKNLFNQTDLVFSAHTGAVEHKFLAGVEFGRQETDNLRRTGRFASPAQAPCLPGSTATSCVVPLADPSVSVPVTYTNTGSDAHQSVVTRVAALYAQDQIEFSSRWQAIIGLRHDRFEIDYTDLRASAAPANRVLSSSDDLLSPRLGLVYKPADNLSLYTSYGITYLPRSGEQMTSLSPTTKTLEPEEFHNYEVGAKWEIRPDLTANAAVYRLDRSNAAVADPADPTRMILLGGESQRVEGTELSLAGKLTDAWQVIASYAYQDGRTTQDVGSTPAGRVLPQTPRHAIGIWNRYDFSPRWGVGLGAIYRDSSFASISNAVTLKSYTRYDAAVFHRISDAVQAQLNIENLFDKKYYPAAHSDSNISTGAPLGAYLSLNVSF